MAFRRKKDSQRPAPVGPSLDVVVPLVRVDLNREQLAPKDRATLHLGDGDPATPVIDFFVGSLIVLYAFDLPDRFQMVTFRDLDSLATDRAGLGEAARSNLTRRLADLELHESSDGYGMLRLDGNLEASTLLLPEPWSRLAAERGGSVAAVVPARDVVLYCDPANSSARAAMTAARDRVLARGDHTITKDVLIFDGEAWRADE